MRAVSVREIFGLNPWQPALSECWTAIAGDKYLPPTIWGLSSLKIFKPWISFPTWLGGRGHDKRAPIYNFVNRKRPALGQAYSVKVTDCQDYQGGQWTYDGHNGTDFAIPAGTVITAVAPGKVLRVRNEMNRGGLKVIIDHGRGLLSSSNHCARALVQPGETVQRGQAIALSGMSSVDGVLFFPWLAPHLHLTIFLNGFSHDPFAKGSETSLWVDANDPKPHTGDADGDYEATEWNHELIADCLKDCKNPEYRARIEALPSKDEQAIELTLAQNFFSPLFTHFPSLVAEPSTPEPRLSLPFQAKDYEGVALPAKYQKGLLAKATHQAKSESFAGTVSSS